MAGAGGESYFDDTARHYDEKPGVKELAGNVVDTLFAELPDVMWEEANVMDFGCGTGNVALQMAARVRSITGVDSSQGMLEVMKQKAQQQGAENISCHCLELKSADDLPGQRFDLIVSSMTAHHLDDIQAMIRVLAQLLKPGGVLAFFDLQRTDSSDQFHGGHQHKHAGVYHSGGFSSEEFTNHYSAAGLTNVRCLEAFSFSKHIPEDDVTRQFPIMAAFASAPK
eukprot:jgi/Chlat1/4131/Chrsp269S03963